MSQQKSLQQSDNDDLWVEKYRPQSIEDCILPHGMKSTFQGFVDQQKIPNLLLSGGPGIGKTTVAKAMLKELGFDCYMVNGSLDVNLDLLRVNVAQFASTKALFEGGHRKYVIIDEADYLNAQHSQPALRGFIEEFSGNCGFIFTCNFPHKIIEALRSRCSVIDFTFTKDDCDELAGQFFSRTLQILDNEGVTYDKASVAQLIKKHSPDWRRVLNELQRYSANKNIDSGVLVQVANINLDRLVKLLKKKKWTEVRKWVAENGSDFTELYRSLYDQMYDYVVPGSLPQLVITLGEYQYKAAFVADAEINTMAMLTEVMSDVEFK